jgi:hypothetical protein
VSNLYELEVRVSIRQSPGYGGALEIADRVMVPATGFLEICQVLGQFHELAESLKAAHETGE